MGIFWKFCFFAFSIITPFILLFLQWLNLSVKVPFAKDTLPQWSSSKWKIKMNEIDLKSVSKLGPCWKPLISKHWQQDTISTHYG